MRVLVLWLVCLPVFAAGTLHDASVREWRNAVTLNKIETAADWVAAVNAKTHMLGRSPNQQTILNLPVPWLAALMKSPWMPPAPTGFSHWPRSVLIC